MYPTTSSSTRELADLVHHLDEAIQQLHCLGLESVDLQSLHGVDVGVHLGAIEALVRQTHARLASMLSQQLSCEHEVREDSPAYAAVSALKN